MVTSGDLVVRSFVPGDAEALTRLLHAAYAELGEMGLNFTAVDQSVEVTLARAGAGQCWVVEGAGELVATMTMCCPPGGDLPERVPEARTPGRAWLNQLAVAPDRRGEGLAGRLWRLGRRWALDRGATAVGLDTAVPATHLVELYRGWGFVETGNVHWPGKTYDSVVLVCPLAGPGAG